LLLARLVARDPAGPSILGDVHEDYVRRARRDGVPAARRWYRREVFSLALHRGIDAVRAPFARNGIVYELSRNPGWFRDVALALRRFRREPVFALLMVLVIGLGVGATTAIYSVLRPLMIAPLPFENPEQLVWIENDGDRSSLSSVTSRTSNLRDFRALGRSFDGLTGYFAFFDQASYAWVGSGPPEQLTGVGVAHDFLDVLGIEPAVGRGFSEVEGRWAGPRAVILSHGLWIRRFAGDPDVVGRSLTLNGEPWEVVGVLPSSFDFASVFKPGVTVDILVPFPIADETDRWGNTLSIIGRLGPGATVASAQADLDGVLTGLAEADPDRWGLTARVSPLRDYVAGGFRPALLLLAAAAGAVVLLVCVNVANVLLARSPKRARDVAVRKALGATRGQIVRQLLIETVTLALAGGALGAVLATAAARMVAATTGIDIPLLQDVRVETSALAVAFLAALGTGIAAGVVPALRVADGAESNTLRGTGRAASQGPGTRGLLEGLVVAEVALACVLLLAGGLFLRSFQAVLDVDLGFDPENAVTWRLNPGADFQSLTETTAFYQEVTRRVAELPGVEAVGLVDALPLGKNRNWGFRVEGAPETDEPLGLFPHLVDAGYREAMGIGLVAGRDLSIDDTPETAPVVLINRSAAEQLFPGESALGRRIFTGGGDVPREIVGVVEDVRHVSPEAPSGIQVYFPTSQLWDFGTLDLVVRSDRATAELAPVVSGLLAEIDPAMPTRDFTTLGELVSRSVSPRRFTLRILTAFGGVALLLAALGIYGVLSHSVSERRREIAIRMAMGATASEVRRAVVGRTLLLAAAGLVVGLLVGVPGSRALESLLFGVSPLDPVTLASLSVLLLAVATGSGAIPAVRAARVDSLKALRAE
jgi:predicted permease